MERKTCAKCWAPKPLDEFYNEKSSWCKKCHREATSEWQKKNPERNHAKQKRWRQAHPEQAKAADAKSNARKKQKRQEQEQ